MSKLIQDLEHKFHNLTNSTKNKIIKLNDSYDREIKNLNEIFITENVIEKYENELNAQRSRLLAKMSTARANEINKINEIICLNRNIEEFKNLNGKIFNFQPNKIKSFECSIKILLNREFKFVKTFNFSQILKYRYLLTIHEYFNKKKHVDVL